jgi:murein DD-endopeptidase MepM/ murein hydrolase activator NlpD
MKNISANDFAKVMDYPDDPGQMYLFNFTKGYDPEFIRSKEWGIGRYNEKRSEMYVAPQYKSKRDIHMGIDIWTRADAPVYSFADGVVAYSQDNNQPGDYGPTTVIKYVLDSTELFVLYGHLSRASLQQVSVGEQIAKGQHIADLGSEKVNGGWAPHLHVQLSTEDPKEADMPGVVADEEHEQALEKYPDPRIILGELY